MKHKLKTKSVLSALLSTIMLLGSFPAVTFAAQSNEYVDPADHWLSSNGRTNELDMNATTTFETSWCPICNKETTVLTYRVPEYTRSGQTAKNRGIWFSDGRNVDGTELGNLDDGTPGVNAYYTGFHWTKSVCQNCGTINAIDGVDAYNFNRNVYSLNACDHNFFLDFDNTTYEPYNKSYHTTILKAGKYCQFCKGTEARASEKRESHNFSELIDGQLGNNRFYVSEHCEDCGYETSEYVTAKSVVSSYYGTADGEAHTVTVSDLSDSGVKTSIRYGNSADACTKTSAPNYTQPGYYTVYYKIIYSYDGEDMTENGVSYVWLLDDNSKAETESGNNTIIVIPPAHEHDFRYLETVPHSCENLGYERWQCDGCGQLDKKNYTPAIGHNYEDITIKDATCEQNGLVLSVCKNCGDFHQTTTPKGEHTYKTEKHNATCRMTGYTDHICEVCGNNYITDITPIISHSYERITKEPTCEDKGYTTSTCTMCGSSYVSDYTEPTGHSWDEGHAVTSSTCTAEGVMEYHCKNENCDEKMIKATSANGHTPGKAATCTEPQICTVCETVLELPTGHHYESTVIPPTCTSMGYTVYECEDCGETYNADFTDKTEHDYKTTVKEPTCTEHGYTTYKCADCDAEYVSDYTDKKPHNYNSVVTAPTCTSMGFTTFTCDDCSDSYVGSYTDMTEHNYKKETVEPTCTEHGYAVYTCPDCGKSYIGDYTDCKEHHYTETVIAPTCTEMGYTIFKCEDCEDEYKGNYTDKIPHNYVGTVTEPTCLELGYTTYVCSVCNDAYKADYKEPKGHTPTDWIIDIPATIEHNGNKHTECTVCGETLQSAELAQLIGRDFTDEDGNAIVGQYNIKLSDKNNMPIFNSEITIDVDDNVKIILPDGRLLDFADRTTISVTKTDTNKAVKDLQIHITDKNGNNATGITDENGKLVVPNDKSSTTDDNGTIGAEIGKNKKTFVVTVTDKINTIIPNCNIRIGESNNIVIDLPEGVKPTRENPVIVTVTDHNGVAQKDITVIAIGEADFIEKGVTDIYGKITLPNASDGYTDENGKVNVDNINVIVNDENAVIPNAYVVHNEDGTISVTLPEENLITYANRITVTVLDSMGTAMANINVTVKDISEKSYTATTNENGSIVVPPLSEDMTDSEGKAVVNGYNILLTDETKAIENAFIVIADNKISVILPENVFIDVNNRITATVTDKDTNPVNGMSVTFTDSTEKSETNLTDENGKAVVPPTNIDVTDINGYGELNGYSVIVKNETAPIEKAELHIDENNNISVKLPESVKFDYKNRITVIVSNKADGTPASDMSVTVNETVIDNLETETDESLSAKTLSGLTDKDGMVVFPPLSEDITDDKGNSDVTDKKDDTETKYIVSVKDTKGDISNALVEVKDGKVYVTLPETHTLTTSNQTTVTVLDKDSKPVSGVSVTIKDKTTEKTGTTNSNGQVTLPVKSSGGGGGSSSGGSGGGGGGFVSTNTTNVKVTDKDGKTVNVSKSTDKDGNVTLTLPTGKMLDGDNYYTITTTDRYGKVKADVAVTLKDKKGNSANGKTDKNGTLILPATEHKAYIFGYDDGTFRPDNNMTRAEASAIFARLIAEEKGETIKGSSKFTDVSSIDWHNDYIGYANKYNIVEGYNDGMFKPDEPVTRAEFVAMAVRYYKLFNEIKDKDYTVKYTDVNTSYWAYNDIAIAKNIGWLNGYADGTFKGDNNITRAEVVTVANRATGRVADEEYISKNTSILNKFSDLTVGNHWAKNEIFEAANTHMANTTSEGESWIK